MRIEHKVFDSFNCCRKDFQFILCVRLVCSAKNILAFQHMGAHILYYKIWFIWFFAYWSIYRNYAVSSYIKYIIHKQNVESVGVGLINSVKFMYCKCIATNLYFSYKSHAKIMYWQR